MVPSVRRTRNRARSVGSRVLVDCSASFRSHKSAQRKLESTQWVLADDERGELSKKHTTFLIRLHPMDSDFGHIQNWVCRVSTSAHLAIWKMYEVYELTEGSRWFTAGVLRMVIANCREKWDGGARSAPDPVRKRIARWFGWALAARLLCHAWVRG